MAIKGYEVRFIFTILFICIFAEANSQHRLPPLDFDQFRKDVAAAQSPEEKLKQYVDIALQVFRYHPDSLFTFAKEIQKLQGLEPAKRKAFKHFFLAYAWRSINRDSAIYYGVKASDYLKKISQHRQYLLAEKLLGEEYLRKADFLDAEAAFLEGISYKGELDSLDHLIQHSFYGSLGSLYSRIGANDLAVNMFEKHLEYVDNPNSRCHTISNLSRNLMNLDKLDEAERMMLPCLQYPQLAPPIQAIIRSNLSRIVGKMGQEQRALELMDEAAFIATKYRIPNLSLTNLVSLGYLYLGMGRIQNADSVRILIEKTLLRRLRPHYRIDKAVFFSDLFLAKHNYLVSVAYADTAIHVADVYNLRPFLKHAYETKAKAYEKLGELELAVKNLKLQEELEEFQDDRAKQKNLAMMKVRYQLQNKEDELAFVSTRLNIMSTRSALLLGLAIVIGLACGFIYSRYRKSRSNEEMQATELYERDITIAELEQKVVEQNRKLKERNIPEWIALNSQVKLSLDEIRYIRSEGNYVKIFLSDVNRAPMMERLTLKQCEEMLPDEITMRIHRSTIVNIRHVSHISDEVLFLKDSTQLKISRRYRKELVSFLG